MKFINTKTHGYLDYLMGVFLIIAPWVFNLEGSAPESVLLIAVGVGVILYSLLTDYELGVAGMIPMGVHLALDVLSGILLALSPWLFGFADRVYLPHLILGLLEIGAGTLTITKSRKMY